MNRATPYRLTGLISGIAGIAHHDQAPYWWIAAAVWFLVAEQTR